MFQKAIDEEKKREHVITPLKQKPIIYFKYSWQIVRNDQVIVYKSSSKALIQKSTGYILIKINSQLKRK